MSTRSSARNIFPPLANPELTIRRRSRADPTLLNDFEMATERNGDPPVLDLQTIEELCQPSLNGRGGPIAPIAIQATNFRLKNDMIQQVQNSCQFHGLSGDDANKHLDKLLHVTQSIKGNGVTNNALRLCTNHNMLPVTQIDTFYNGLTLRHRDTINAAARGTFMKRRPEECYNLIENMTAHHNDWDTSAQRSESSTSITSSFDTEIAALKAEMAEINKNLLRVLQVNQQVKAVTPSCETCGGPHSFNDCPATVGQTRNVYAAGAYQGGNSYQLQGNRNLLSYRSDNYLGPPGNNQGRNQFFQGSSHGQNPPPAYQAPAYQAPGYQALGITTRSGTAYQGPTIPTTSSSLPPVVECETEATKDKVHPTNNGCTKDVQPSVVQTKSPILNSEPVIALIIEPVAALVSALKPNQKLSIPYPSRLHDQKLRDKANDQIEKIFQIFKDLNFNISFAYALILMPSLARLSKKLPKKLGDPAKFLIPCDFPEMAECLALADLGASINLMPLSVWNKLSFPELTPTLMTLKLADWSISRPIGVTEDVYVNVGKFHFPPDFVVIDFDADPRVPLILGRSFLKTERALIDVFEGELTLRVGKEAITF
nr:reverse transcriptase domain-containing protein [Tanacetum cinerariifolium]